MQRWRGCSDGRSDDKRPARGPARDLRQGWDEIIDAELRVNNDGTIVALSADMIGDVGAYSVYPWTAVIEPIQVASFMPGPYRVPILPGAGARGRDPQGAARPQSRRGPAAGGLCDGGAHRSRRAPAGIDPAELRMRNFVRDEEFPDKTATGIVWDRAGFIECMKKACETLDYDGGARGAGADARGRTAGRDRLRLVAELTGIGSATPAAPGMPVPAGTEAATISVGSVGHRDRDFRRGLARPGAGNRPCAEWLRMNLKYRLKMSECASATPRLRPTAPAATPAAARYWAAAPRS